MRWSARATSSTSAATLPSRSGKKEKHVHAGSGSNMRAVSGQKPPSSTAAGTVPSSRNWPTIRNKSTRHVSPWHPRWAPNSSSVGAVSSLSRWRSPPRDTKESIQCAGARGVDSRVWRASTNEVVASPSCRRASTICNE
eukprot:scaffold123396_cov30-Tisochrysis_lutea.AAC.5